MSLDRCELVDLVQGFNLINHFAAVLYNELQLRLSHSNSFAPMRVIFRTLLLAMGRVKHVGDVKASPGDAGFRVALDPKKVLNDGNIS